MATQLACSNKEFKDRVLLNKIKIFILLKCHSQFMSAKLILQFNFTNLTLNIVSLAFDSEGLATTTSERHVNKRK